LELRQSTDLRQTLTVSPQFILSQRLLQMTTIELAQEITTELAENPALEIVEITTCPHCHRPMSGSRCEHCGNKQDLENERLEQFIQQQRMNYDSDEEYYESQSSGEDGDDVPLEQYAQRAGGFHDFLMTNFLATPYRPELRELAEYLIYSVDDDGFLSYELAELEEKFGAGAEDVEGIVEIIKTLEPAGVGAANAREALLIQIKVLSEEGLGNETAERIILDHFEDLGKGRHDIIAKALGIEKSEVLAALDYIRRNLTPYPARAYSGRAAEMVELAKPAIAIKYDGSALSYEILEMSDFNLRVNKTYLDMYESGQTEEGRAGRSEMAHIKNYFRRAKFFIDSINQRRETMEKIAAALCEEQKEFLTIGLPHFNSELTQGRLADKIGLHESTVSRAMSGKYVIIPALRGERDGKILSFDFFFDSSVRPKEYIRNIIAKEDPDDPISDGELRDRLAKQGIDIARRTVANYRNEMGIPSTYERRRAR